MCPSVTSELQLRHSNDTLAEDRSSGELNMPNSVNESQLLQKTIHPSVELQILVSEGKLPSEVSNGQLEQSKFGG